MNPPFLESALHDIFFNLLDGDRGLVDAENARGLAGRGTNAPGKFREIVGGMQLADSFLPAPAINEIIPVRNEIVHRAAGVAERHTAIHAAGSLVAKSLLGEILIDLEPVVHPLRDRRAAAPFADTP